MYGETAIPRRFARLHGLGGDLSLQSDKEARKERMAAFSQLATLGLTALGMAEIAPMFFSADNYGFSTRATPDLALGEATGKVLDRVPWIKVACGFSLVPVIMEATKRIPTRVGIPPTLKGSWKMLIGKTYRGKWVFFDFGDVVPLYIVAGAMMFGKTAFIKTVLYTLCRQQSERHLNILIVDRKGGASFAAWKHVPHVLDVQKELKGAKKVLEDAEQTMWDRLGAIEQAKLRFEPAPEFAHLFVVIDEGSLLKLDDDCMQHLQNIAAIGREPRVHIMYGTQRPSAEILPVVIRDQMEGRFVMTVNEPGSSRVVLGDDNTDAYRLSKHPGRMIHRSADGQVELQAAYVPEEVITEWIRGYVTDTGPVRALLPSVEGSYVEITHERRTFTLNSTPSTHAHEGVVQNTDTVDGWD